MELKFYNIDFSSGIKLQNGTKVIILNGSNEGMKNYFLLRLSDNYWQKTSKIHIWQHDKDALLRLGENISDGDLFAQKKVIFFHHNNNKNNKQLANLLQDVAKSESFDGVVCIISSAIYAKDQICTNAKNDKNMLLVSCYEINQNQKKQFIRNLGKNIDLSDEIIEYLAYYLSDDLIQIYQELQKIEYLKLASGDIKLTDITFLIKDNKSHQINNFLEMLFSKNINEFQRIYAQLEDQFSDIAFLTIIENHLKTLLLLKVKQKQGKSIEQAFQTLDRKLHFSLVNSIKTYINEWELDDLKSIYHQCTEIKNKITSGMRTDDFNLMLYSIVTYKQKNETNLLQQFIPNHI